MTLASRKVARCEASAVERLTAREGEQPMRQCSRARGSRLRRADIARQIVDPPLVQAKLHQLQRARDAGQQIVEIVREAAGQLSDRLHLLGLPQPLLQFALAADVDADTDDLARLAVRVAQHVVARYYPAHTAVGQLQTIFIGTVAASRTDMRDCGLHLGQVLRVDARHHVRQRNAPRHMLRAGIGNA